MLFYKQFRDIKQIKLRRVFADIMRGKNKTLIFGQLFLNKDISADIQYTPFKF